MIHPPTFNVQRGLWLVGGCLLFVAALVACSPPGAQVVPTFVPPPTYGPSPGSTHTVERGSIVETIEARGQVMAKQEALLTFPMGGTLKTVYVLPGDQVEKGMLLAELDAPGVRQNAVAAQLHLRMANAQLKKLELQMEMAEVPDTALDPMDAATDVLIAEIAFERTKVELRYARVEFEKALQRHWDPPEVTEAVSWTLRLNEWNYQIAEAKLEQAMRAQQRAWQSRRIDQANREIDQAIQDIELEMAKMDVENARIQEDWATEQLSNTLLLAPLSGVVVSIEKRPGDQVGSYETVGIIADPSQLWAVATILEEDVERIGVGQPVTIRLDVYPDRVYTGTVLQIVGQETIWQGGNAYAVTIAFDEDQDVPMAIRMGADVTITGRTRENVLLVPSGAVLTIGGRGYVEVVQGDGDVERTEVQVGISDGVNTEIISGLQAGQEIRMP